MFVSFVPSVLRAVRKVLLSFSVRPFAFSTSVSSFSVAAKSALMESRSKFAPACVSVSFEAAFLNATVEKFSILPTVAAVLTFSVLPFADLLPPWISATVDPGASGFVPSPRLTVLFSVVPSAASV